MIAPERHAALAAQPVTLDGQPAQIAGIGERFATVRQVPSGLGAEWSWDAVARVVSNGGSFQS